MLREAVIKYKAWSLFAIQLSNIYDQILYNDLLHNSNVRWSILMWYISLSMTDCVMIINKEIWWLSNK